MNATAVRIPAGPVLLDGDYTQPPTTDGVVLFAHGSGSSRHSPRNRYVAAALNRVGFATCRALAAPIWRVRR